MICGVFGAISITPSCIAAGAIMMYVNLLLFFSIDKLHFNFFCSFLGFSMIMFEVPICCQFVSYTQPVARFSEKRPAWQKAMIYSMLVN